VKTYSEKLRDPRWQQKRLLIMQRDRWQCRDCTDSTKNLQVHHCHYRRGVEPWDIEDQFLLTLCEDCHLERQELENGARVALALLMAASSRPALEKLADALSSRASDIYTGHTATDWLGEDRWVEYAIQYPDMRVFVEMVLGHPVQWPTPSRS
jgi:hypothetical protein